MSLWIRCRAFVLGALPAVIAACSDSIVAPTANRALSAKSNTTASVSPSSGASQLHTNDQKYSDKGYHPATGRSGTAGIQVRALERKDGSMFVDVTTGDFDVPGSSGGYLTRVLAKVTTKDQHVSTKSYAANNVVTYTFDPFRAVRGSAVFVQANVRGKDNNRTDVVTANDTVRMGADLAVDRIEAASQARVGDVFTVSAVISERNGDIGGRTDAVLYVDGVRTDVANRVWVDAGGQVTVSFAARSSVAGVHQLAVKLENLLPFDYDPTNNSASRSITLVTAPLLYNATAFEHSGTYHDYYQYNYADYPGTGGYSTQYNLNWDEQIRYQSTHVYSWVEQGIAFPVTNVSVGLKTDATQIESLSFANFAATQTYGDATNGGACGVSIANGSTVIVCTNHVPTATGGTANWSSLTYDRYAGSVTYVATQWSSYVAPWGQGWYYNVDPAVTVNVNSLFGASVPFGSTVSFSLSLASGSALFTAQPVVTLTPNGYTTSAAWCNSFPNDANTGLVKECYDQGGLWSDKEGFVWAPGL